MQKPKLIIFASGTKDGGGSGARELLRNNRTGVLDAYVVGLVSNHKKGGVKALAKEYKVPFFYFPGPYTPEDCLELLDKSKAEWVAFSGWLKLLPIADRKKGTTGLDPRTTFNIHPGPLPQFGGDGMYGDHVHKAVMGAYRQGKVSESAVSMHFVTGVYDEGPVFFNYPISIEASDTWETLKKRANKIEHGWQSWVTNLVIHKKISWNGEDPASLNIPDLYYFHD